MKFKQQRSPSIPEVNLVPMIDVLMSVLIFFIITSMTLTSQSLGSIKIPGGLINKTSEQQQQKKPTLIIGLDKEKTILLNSKSVNEAEMIDAINKFLSEQSSGEVIIKADEKLSYQEISQFLNKLSKISNQQVFLAIDKEN